MESAREAPATAVESRLRSFSALWMWLPAQVARIPAPIHTKMLVAFLTVVAALIALGLVALQVLGAANDRAEGLGRLEQKVAAYSNLQTVITRQLFNGASAFSAPDAASLDGTLRQIRQTQYDFERLRFVTRDEGAILDDVERDYNLFVDRMEEIVALIRAGNVTGARALQSGEARELADSLERRTNELVNRTEAEIATTINDNHEEYIDSRWVVVSFAAGSIALALALGYAISFSVIDPVKRMSAYSHRVAAGDFGGQVEVANRDELGTLAANLNRMNDDLGRAYRELEGASQHKSEFLANMSHELRTPLNAVIGFSEVLQERMFGELNERQADYVGEIVTAGKHLLDLINDILDLSKVEAGRMELDRDEFVVADALESGLSMLRERALRRGVALTLEVDRDVATIEADERKVKQVVFNLLSNAVKFTPSGGSVRLAARAAVDEVVISVRDTGIGIAPDDLERIFQAFQQARRKPGTEQEGTGLGLALAKRFVELHGGRLWVESRVGEGSTFSFALPCARPAPAVAEATVSPAGVEILQTVA